MLAWFRTKAPEEEVEQRLAQLETKARTSKGHEAQHLLQAGDLCARMGQVERALRYYGRALDHYLETGRLAAAEALCRRMLDVAPETVRVRSTRMWLVAARGTMEEARVAVTEYVQAGTAAAQEDLVAHQLALLAEAGAPGIRELAAEALLDLGAVREADRLLGTIYAERNGDAPVAIPLPDHQWAERMLEAMLLHPEQARQRLLGTVP